MSIQEIDNSSLKFLNTPNENNAINLLRCIRCHNMYNLAIYIGEYLISKFPYLLDLKDEYSISAYYLNEHNKAFDVLQDALNMRGLSQEKSWKILFNQHFSIDHVCNRYTFYNESIVKSILEKKPCDLPRVSFSITTCKRFDLFEQTINSFLNCVQDLYLIDNWYCVDDNSSDEDREKMKRLYPFFTFYFKTKEEKGHPQSMNIIKNLVKTPYLIHSEDDFKFFSRRNYVTDALDVLSCDNKIGQCLFNKNYSEIESDIDIKGGIFKISDNGVRYFIHEYAKTEDDIKKWVEKYGNYKNSSYWPHFSFRPSLLRTEIFQNVGSFNEKISHFEMDYAHRYFNSGYISSFFEGISCLHIGRLTSERDDHTKLNAYSLNDEKQFYGKEDSFLKADEKQFIINEKVGIEMSPKINENELKFKAFVVNLDRRPDRWDLFIKNSFNSLSFLKYERFSAVDGSKLVSTRQLQQIFENNDYSMRRGMVGCFMSHIKLFTNLINENDKNIESYLILEDDVEFQPDFEKKFKHFMKQLDNVSWDLAFLGHHVRDKNNTSFFDKEKMPEISKTDVYQSFCQSLGGTTGFIVSKKGAEKFLDFLNKTGATNGIDTCIQKSANQLDIYYCTPHLIFSECFRGDNLQSLDTDIQHDFDSLEKTIEERLKGEIDYLNSKNIKTIKASTYDFFKEYIKTINEGESIYYEGDENEISKIEKSCCYPNYKIGEKIIIVLKTTDINIECYFHRYKKGFKFDVDNAIKY
jgi:GR25 family glycosyltransferase involved in LPS biosynthesis